jgi:glycosyltransferase involved in cell wall biosynthesis
MRILLWHGYLLSGSGSNLYTRNLARVWRAKGHDVLLMCQERHAEKYDFIDQHGDMTPDNLGFDLVPADAAPSGGRCRLVRPWIGEILPVYVYDDYEGLTAKRFVDLTDSELEDYTQANVQAMITVIEAHGSEAIITGHEVMGPYIALKACERTGTSYVAKLHGSALEYAVKKQPRYVAYAAEGLGGAKRVIGGSSYMVREASAVVPGWGERAVVVNPGCDVDLFRPVVQTEPAPFTIGYVGKLIVSKGVHNLLAALMFVRDVDLRCLIVGYGGFEQELRNLWDALRSGDLDRARDIANAGDGRPLEDVVRVLEKLSPEEAAAASARVDLEFTGRLDHGPLARLLPSLDVLLVPSVLAEAFGMVAAEAAACGVLPVVPRHSGISEVGTALEEAIGRPGLLTFDPSDPVTGIVAAIEGLHRLPEVERREIGEKIAAVVRSRWSWETVAGRLLELAANR